jgi:uncharacterized alkaline shock family protein YloU
MRELGVQVEVGKREAACDLRIVAEYGESIPRIAKEIRESISTNVLQLTGLHVTEVNIEVVDLSFGDEPDEPEAPRVE